MARLVQGQQNRQRIDVETVSRYDVGDFGKAVRLDNGYLRADAHITRTGVFIYRNPDGTPRRELRLPEDVFHADALASFELVPVCVGHPSQELLNASNTARHQSGTVTNVRQDGETFVAATIQLTDASAIASAEAGNNQLSCGYNCDLEILAGVTKDIPGVPDGLRFDAIQRNIRGNHVALVKAGKAGAGVTLRLDHGEHVTTQDSPKENHTMRIDGVDFEVPAQTEQAVDKALADKDKEILRESARADSAEESAKSEKTRADEVEAKLADETKRADAAVDPEVVQAAVKARVKLETDATRILGERKEDAKPLADLSDEDIQREVVLQSSPDTDADKLKGDYLGARYDHVVETFKADATGDEPNTGLALLRANTPRFDGAAPKNSISEARARMEKESREAWQPKTAQA